MEEHLDRDRLLNDPMSFIPDDLLDDIIVRRCILIRSLEIDIRVMTEISNVMGWETNMDTHTGADPGFFPRGGPGHSATETQQAS